MNQRYKVVPDADPNHDGWTVDDARELQCGDEFFTGLHVVQHLGPTPVAPPAEDDDTGLSMYMQSQRIAHRRC